MRRPAAHGEEDAASPPRTASRRCCPTERDDRRSGRPCQSVDGSGPACRSPLANAIYARQPTFGRRWIMSAAFSAIITTGEAVLPETIFGMIDASTTRSRSIPCTRRSVRRPPARRCPSCTFRPGGRSSSRRCPPRVHSSSSETTSGPGRSSSGRYLLERRRRHDPTCLPDRRDSDLLVACRGQVVQPDLGLSGEVATDDVGRTDAVGAKVDHGDRDRRETDAAGRRACPSTAAARGTRGRACPSTDRTW